MHNPMDAINREKQIRDEIEPHITKIMRQWERGLITCRELAQEIEIEVLKAEAQHPEIRTSHTLTVIGSEGTCSCGWTATGCATDLIEEWDQHDKTTPVGMLPELPPGIFVDEFTSRRG